MSEESEEGVIVIRQGGAAPRALNWDKESCEHLRWTPLEQAQYCTDLPRVWVGMNVTAHQQNEETKKGKRKEKEKTSDRF